MSYTNLLTHVVFSTKERFPFLHDIEFRNDVHAYLGGIVRNLKGHALHINGVADHVHMLLALPPTLSIADLVRTTKSNSSRWIHETRSKPRFAWQVKYAAFSVSQSNAERVRNYIAKQEAHHKRASFQDELLALLRKHEIEFDERYLWQ